MINKESTKAGVIVMAMILAMFALAGFLQRDVNIDATWEEQYPRKCEVAIGVLERYQQNWLGNIQITNYCTCKITIWS